MSEEQQAFARALEHQAAGGSFDELEGTFDELEGTMDQLGERETTGDLETQQKEQPTQ